MSNRTVLYFNASKEVEQQLINAGYVDIGRLPFAEIRSHYLPKHMARLIEIVVEEKTIRNVIGGDHLPSIPRELLKEVILVMAISPEAALEYLNGNV